MRMNKEFKLPWYAFLFYTIKESNIVKERIESINIDRKTEWIEKVISSVPF